MFQGAFDIIVTDIQMPGITGVKLLEEVRKNHPQTVRIALSGQADAATVFQSVGPVHQYLSKPCEAETLKSTMTRACALQELLGVDKLRGAISQIKSLPSLPSRYDELMEEFQSETASLNAVERIISQDIGMSAKVMQLISSAFFGPRRHVSGPAEAVTILGLDTVKALVLSVDMFFRFDQTEFPLDGLWNHSMIVATAAKQIAMAANAEKKTIDYAFIAGLFHDVGKLALAVKFPEKYASVSELAEKEKSKITEAEHKIFGATHAEAGAYLLGLWGLPDPIIGAVAFHHNPTQSPTKESIPLTAIHAANVMVCEACSNDIAGGLPQIDEGYLAELNLKEQLPAWQKISQEAVQKHPAKDMNN